MKSKWSQFFNLSKHVKNSFLHLEVHLLPVFQVLLQDDQARSQEKEYDR